MKIPVFILMLFGTSALALQAWTLNAIVDLKSDVAALKYVISVNQNHNLTRN